MAVVDTTRLSRVRAQVNLLALVKLRPSVLHLGVKGALLLARLLSIPDGFKFLTDANYVDHELRKWRNVSFCCVRCRGIISARLYTNVQRRAQKQRMLKR